MANFQINNGVIESVIEISKQAGLVIMDIYKTDFNIKFKNDKSPVTEADTRANDIITAELLMIAPDIPILSEEGRDIPFEERSKWESFWLVDPLDGTTNFIHGYPQFGISIAVAHQGRIEHGLVFDPLRDELFTASRGQGARLNDRRIRVSRTQHLNRALLGTGFPVRTIEKIDPWLKTFRALLPKASGIRRAGAATLDLAHVAAGRFDGFWEMGLKPWDMAAGILLVREAGGLVADFDGGQGFLESGNIVAANSVLFNELLRVVHGRSR